MLKGGKSKDLRGTGQGGDIHHLWRCCTNPVSSAGLDREKSQICRRPRVRMAPAMDTSQPMDTPQPHTRGHGHGGQGATPEPPCGSTRAPWLSGDPSCAGSSSGDGTSRCPRMPFWEQEAEWQQGHGGRGQGSLPFRSAKLIIMANMPRICLLCSPHCSFNQKLLSNYILLFLCLCVNHFPRELVFNCCLICIIMHINLHT